MRTGVCFFLFCTLLTNLHKPNSHVLLHLYQVQELLGQLRPEGCHPLARQGLGVTLCNKTSLRTGFLSNVLTLWKYIP